MPTKTPASDSCFSSFPTTAIPDVNNNDKNQQQNVLISCGDEKQQRQQDCAKINCHSEELSFGDKAGENASGSVMFSSNSSNCCPAAFLFLLQTQSCPAQNQAHRQWHADEQPQQQQQQQRQQQPMQARKCGLCCGQQTAAKIFGMEQMICKNVFQIQTKLLGKFLWARERSFRIPVCTFHFFYFQKFKIRTP